MERLWIQQKAHVLCSIWKGIRMGKKTPLESTTCPESARIILTSPSPICVQVAPATLAVREPKGLFNRPFCGAR
eukprot:6538849-Pyramimonas_sp.AAC.1